MTKCTSAKLLTVLVSMESDSAPCYSARSLTWRSVSQRGVTYFANISVKMNLSAKLF